MTECWGDGCSVFARSAYPITFTCSDCRGTEYPEPEPELTCFGVFTRHDSRPPELGIISRDREVSLRQIMIPRGVTPGGVNHVLSRAVRLRVTIDVSAHAPSASPFAAFQAIRPAAPPFVPRTCPVKVVSAPSIRHPPFLNYNYPSTQSTSVIHVYLFSPSNTCPLESLLATV